MGWRKVAVLILAVATLAGGAAFAQGVRRDGIVLGPQGRPVGGATILVCTGAQQTPEPVPCSPTANIFSDLALSVAKGNPTSTDANGNYFYYVAPVKVKEQTSGAGITTSTTADISVGGFDAATIGNLNNIRFVDATGKFTTIQAAHDDFGAVCGEIVVTANLNLSGTTTLSKPGCKLNLGAVTLTFAAGAQLAITGADSEVYGLGDKTLLDASTGTSATSSVYVSSAASRAYLHDFKVTGNRVAGGTAYAVQIGDSNAVLDAPKVERLTVEDAGSIGIPVYKTTNARILNNRIIRPNKYGIYLAISGHRAKVTFNYVEDPNKSISGATSGIHLLGTVTTDFTHNQINWNDVRFTTSYAESRGFELDYLEDSEIIGNTVAAAGGTGEGISITGRRLRVGLNTVHGSGTGGILFWLATTGTASDFQVFNNTTYDNTSYGINFTWDAASLTLSNVIISGNRSMQVSGTQNNGLQFNTASKATPAVSNVFIVGNDWFGNAASTITYDAALTTFPTILERGVNDWQFLSTQIVHWRDSVGGTLNGFSKTAIDEILIGGIKGTRSSRFKANGTALVAGDFALSAGWGDGPGTVTGVRGTDQFFEFIVTSVGVGQGASPTITHTPKDGTWTTAPVWICGRQEFANQATVTFTATTQTATSLVLTFNGTPVAAQTFKVACHTGGI